MRLRVFSGGFKSVAFVCGALTVLFASTSCGGGGSSGPITPIPTATNGSSSPAQTQSVAFNIKWPNLSGSSSNRHRSYLSAGTKSIAISVGVGSLEKANQYFNNPTLAAGATSGTDTTTVVNVNAPVGNDTFTVVAYDGVSGAGNELGANAISYTVVIDTANTVSITLNGDLAKIACAGVAPFVSGTTTALTLTGPAGNVQVEPEDADGYIIINPGNIPAVALTAVATAANVSPGASTNEYVVNPLVTATATTLSASGTDLNGNKITGTCTITRDLAMYVANHGLQGANPSVSIYDVAAPTSAETPTAIISGSNTNQNQIQFLAVNNQGALYLSNQGPVPGATYGPTIGYIDAYAPAASGNIAPMSIISGLDRPTGLSFDSTGDLFSTQATDVVEFGPNPTATSTPINTIDVMAATSNPNDEYADVDCYGNFVDSAGTFYQACSNAMITYAKGSTGAVAPTTTLLAPLGNEASSSQSWLSVAADSSGNIYLPASNNNLNLIAEYASGSTGAANPSGTSTGGYTQPWGIYISPAGAVYVTNFGSSTVDVFSSTTLEKLGASTITITSGVSSPYGVTVE